jgi:hypothetical protein
LQYKDNNSALTWHKIRYTYLARIGENARVTLAFPPDSKPHPYIDFMSSQCTVIVYINSLWGMKFSWIKLEMKYSLCLNFSHLLARKPNLEKCSIYSNKFFHNFHLSKSSFTFPGLRASGLAQRLEIWQ